MPFLTGLFRRVATRDQFVIDLIEALKLRSFNVKSYNHKEYALHVEHSAIGPSIVGLNNLFLIWQSRGRDERSSFCRNLSRAIGAAR
jgi:hypothetical protein